MCFLSTSPSITFVALRGLVLVLTKGFSLRMAEDLGLYVVEELPSQGSQLHMPKTLFPPTPFIQQTQPA